MSERLKPLKKKAWKLCSEYNRRKKADSDGMVRCISCGKVAHWKEMQAGHLIAGRCNAILFEDRGIYAQCAPCNYQEGNTVGFMIGLENELGKEEAQKLRDELYALRKTTVKYSASDYEEIALKYQRLCLELPDSQNNR